jgi:hypothetical protein
MPQFIESYYLVDKRAGKLIFDFIRFHSIVKKPLADEYPVPQYSIFEDKIFKSDDELLTFLEANPTCAYNIYWENEVKESLIKQFSAHFTDDGKMILGVAVVGNNLDSEDSVRLFKKIKKHLNPSFACITSEEPPPSNSIEFADFCNRRFIPE